MITIKGIKKNLPYIIVFIVCVAVAAASFMLLNKNYKQPVKMKDIIIISHDLGMYEVLTDNKITVKKVPETTNTEGYFTKQSDVIGKLTAFELKEGKPISKEYVIDKEDIKDLAFITVNSKYAQTGDAKPGDIVDVYRVSLENKEEWIGGNESEKVAEDVIVVALKNKDGKKPGEGSAIPLGGSSSKVEVVKLGIKDKYIENIVPGSVNETNGYVLVVKKPFEKKVSYMETDFEKTLKTDEVEIDKDGVGDGKKEGESIDAKEAIQEGTGGKESEGEAPKEQ
ncbi:MAG: hypothetical protein MJA82_08510 [Clostridia bacterium]|nr:hypothetical protein [Clostridia bacterium]